MLACNHKLFYYEDTDASFQSLHFLVVLCCGSHLERGVLINGSDS